MAVITSTATSSSASTTSGVNNVEIHIDTTTTNDIHHRRDSSDATIDWQQATAAAAAAAQPLPVPPPPPPSTFVVPHGHPHHHHHHHHHHLPSMYHQHNPHHHQLHHIGSAQSLPPPPPPSLSIFNMIESNGGVVATAAAAAAAAVQPPPTNMMQQYGGSIFTLASTDTAVNTMSDESTPSSPSIPMKSMVATATATAIPKNGIELVWRDLSYNIKKSGTHFCNPLKKYFGGNGSQKTEKKSRVLINQLNGSIRSGELTAIIGPSGAGKTTLIECLAGRRLAGVEGDIVVNYNGVSKNSIKVSYYSQRDSLNELLTVDESLMYASKLRNCSRSEREKFSLFADLDNGVDDVGIVDGDDSGDHFTYFTGDLNKHQNESTNLASLPQKLYHRMVVDRLLKELHLTKCSHVRVSKCSGGQKRRLSIALELIFSPTIFLLDEPTSGLDSLSSLQCISMLKKLVTTSARPMIVATSIHQPTAKVMSYFDRLYIISYNGQCIYNGPTGALVSTLNSYGLHCPQYHNPADYVVEIASGDMGEDAIKRLAKHFAQICRQQTQQTQQQSKSSSPPTITDLLMNGNDGGGGGGGDRDGGDGDGLGDDNGCLGGDGDYDDYPLFSSSASTSLSSVKMCKLVQATQKHSMMNQFWTTVILTKRALLMTQRDPNMYIARLVTMASTLILIDILYKNVPIGALDGCAKAPTMDTIEKFQSMELFEEQHLYYANFGFLFYSVILTVFMSILPTLLSFPLEVSVFIKENFNGWYSLKSYYIARNIADFPPVLCFPILYGTCSYLLTDQYFEWHRFLYYQLVLIMTAFLAQGVGFLVSAYFVSNVTTSTVVGAIINIPLFLFTGLLIKISIMPKFFQPITYISYFRLAFESLLVIIYGLDRCPTVEPINFSYLKQQFGDTLLDMFVCMNEYSSSASENITQLIDNYNEHFLNNITETSSNSLALKTFEYGDHTLWFNLIAMVVYVLILRILAYAVLHYKTTVK